MRNAAVALGVFDGVHRGHREIFRRVIARAKALGGTSVVYTFDPHPARILAPDSAPPMINTIGQRVELITSCGIDRVVVQKFTKAFAQQTPEQFFNKIIVHRLRTRDVFVGYNFTFGVRRSGTTETLETLGREADVGVHIASSFLWKGTLVSSTQVRRFLSSGDLPRSEDLLARPYFIEGTVVRGKGIGKKDLNIPTANLKPDNDALLPTGVYVTSTRVGNRVHRSLTNIGSNPTFGPGPLSIETHLLDGFRRNIQGRKIRVEFLQRIREEIRFATAADLANQIRNDMRSAHKVFAGRR